MFLIASFFKFQKKFSQSQNIDKKVVKHDHRYQMIDIKPQIPQLNTLSNPYSTLVPGTITIPLRIET